MRWERALGGTFMSLMVGSVGCLAGGLLISPNVDVGADRKVPARQERVFVLLQDEAGLQKWWRAVEGADGAPEMEVHHVGGPEAGAGAKFSFESGGMTMETWTVIAAEPPSRIVWNVDFAGLMTVERTLTLTPDRLSTDVSWRETGYVGNPLMRYMLVMMGPEEAEANFEMALKGLENAVQAR